MCQSGQWPTLPNHKRRVAWPAARPHVVTTVYAAAARGRAHPPDSDSLRMEGLTTSDKLARRCLAHCRKAAARARSARRSSEAAAPQISMIIEWAATPGKDKPHAAQPGLLGCAARLLSTSGRDATKPARYSGMRATSVALALGVLLSGSCRPTIFNKVVLKMNVNLKMGRAAPPPVAWVPQALLLRREGPRSPATSHPRVRDCIVGLQPTVHLTRCLRTLRAALAAGALAARGAREGLWLEQNLPSSLRARRTCSSSKA